MRELCVLAVMAASAACPQRRPVGARAVVRSEVTYLSYRNFSAISFVDPNGKSCRPLPIEPEKNEMLGWVSPDLADKAICSHDTLYEGVGPAELTLSWSATIPRDGSYELNSFGYFMDVAGTAISRGAWVGDTFATAKLIVDARSPHCSTSWSTPVAAALVSGPFVRAANFGGPQTIPALPLENCKAGDILEVRTRLVADVNRGRVDVESFGFSVPVQSEADHIFGLFPLKPGSQVETDSKCTQWVGSFCNEREQAH
jgi:hypothetical protein